MRYVTGVDEHGRRINVQGPAASVLDWARKAKPPAERLAPALLDMRPIFGVLGQDPRVRMAVTAALARLYTLGARRAVLA